MTRRPPAPDQPPKVVPLEDPLDEPFDLLQAEAPEPEAEEEGEGTELEDIPLAGGELPDLDEPVDVGGSDLADEARLLATQAGDGGDEGGDDSWGEDGEGDDLDWADPEDAPPDHGPDEDHEDELPGGPEEPEDFSDEPAPDEPGLSEEDWGDLESPLALLPKGRLLVGLRERVAIPELGLDALVAAFHTGEERSVLQAEVVARSVAVVSLRVGAEVLELPLLPGEGLALTVVVGAVSRRGVVRLVARTGPPALVMGRDLLEGAFVVDVAQSFVQTRGGS